MIDLKGGAETARGRALFARYATTMADALDLLTEVRDAMKARQEHLRVSRTRKLAVCADWPLELVMVDEMAMLTAYGDRGDVREALRLLAEILTQGRACLISVIGLRAGAVQGHRRRPRAVHHPHLPRRHRRLPRGHGAQAQGNEA